MNTKWRTTRTTDRTADRSITTPGMPAAPLTLGGRAARGAALTAGLAAGLTTLVAALGGCVSTPWNPFADEYQPQPQPVRTQVAAGYYRVNPGDTLTSIAAAFDQQPADIAAWNNLTPDAPVMPGQVMRVAPPAGSAGVTTTPVPPPSVAQNGAPQPSTQQPPPSTPTIRLAWPLQGAVTKPFVAGQNKGIVIAGRPGDPVRAAAAGRVVYAGSGIAAYGPLIIIKHDASVVTAYGQNGQLLVKEGDAVAQGQQIGTVGTDAQGAPSIQFEVRWDGKPVNPLTWLPRPGT